MESDCLGMLVPFRLDWAGRAVALKLRPEWGTIGKFRAVLNLSPGWTWEPPGGALGSSLVVQCVYAMEEGSIPGQGTKILHAARRSLLSPQRNMPGTRPSEHEPLEHGHLYFFFKFPEWFWCVARVENQWLRAALSNRNAIQTMYNFCNSRIFLDCTGSSLLCSGFL